MAIEAGISNTAVAKVFHIGVLFISNSNQPTKSLGKYPFAHVLINDELLSPSNDLYHI